jgi:hypothetical protein
MNEAVNDMRQVTRVPASTAGTSPSSIPVDPTLN